MERLSMVSDGWDVYGSEGDKIGSIDEVGPNYILVRKGLIFPKDIYVPHSAVSDVNPDQTAVMLNVPKSGIEELGWGEPPVATAGTRQETTTDETYGATATQVAGDTSYARGADYEQSRDYATSAETAESDTVRVPRYEEELRAEKQTREAGEVQIRKDVREEERTLDVPVTREDVEVRRVAADRDATADEGAFSDAGGTLRVPVREEQVVVSKEPRVAEELEVRKVAHQDTERVSDTVRREEVDVERTDDATDRTRT